MIGVTERLPGWLQCALAPSAWETNMDRNNPYSLGMDKNAANYVALSPLSFIERAARVYPDHPAVIYGRRR